MCCFLALLAQRQPDSFNVCKSICACFFFFFCGDMSDLEALIWSDPSSDFCSGLSPWEGENGEKQWHICMCVIQHEAQTQKEREKKEREDHSLQIMKYYDAWH